MSYPTGNSCTLICESAIDCADLPPQAYGHIPPVTCVILYVGEEQNKLQTFVFLNIGDTLMWHTNSIYQGSSAPELSVIASALVSDKASDASNIISIIYSYIYVCHVRLTSQTSVYQFGIFT